MKRIIKFGLYFSFIGIIGVLIFLSVLFYSGYREKKELFRVMQEALPTNTLRISYTAADYKGLNSEFVNEYGTNYFRWGFEAPSYKAESKEELYLYDNDPDHWCALWDITRGSWNPSVRTGFIYPDFYRTPIRKVVLAEYGCPELTIQSNGLYRYFDGVCINWLTSEQSKPLLQYVKYATCTEGIRYKNQKSKEWYVRVYYENYPMFENIGTIIETVGGEFYFTPRTFYASWVDCIGVAIDESAFPPITLPE